MGSKPCMCVNESSLCKATNQSPEKTRVRQSQVKYVFCLFLFPPQFVKRLTMWWFTRMRTKMWSLGLDRKPTMADQRGTRSSNKSAKRTPRKLKLYLNQCFSNMFCWGWVDNNISLPLIFSNTMVTADYVIVHTELLAWNLHKAIKTLTLKC